MGIPRKEGELSMNTVQLECFLAVTEHLNFARAAEALNITQPAVTHQINSLEAELSTRLLHRTTRSVALTDAGSLFIGDARNILSLTNAAKMRLIHKSDEEILPFSIGCHSALELQLLPELIQKTKAQFPNLHPITRCAPLPVMKNNLADGSLDILLGFKEKNARRQPGLYTELIKAPAALAVLPEHPLALRQSVALEDLKTGCVILCDPRLNPLILTEPQHLLAGSRPSSDVYFCEQLESALTLIKAGVGYTLLPDIPQMRDSALCYVHFEGNVTYSFGLYYKSLKSHPALGTFVSLAREMFTAPSKH